MDKKGNKTKNIVAPASRLKPIFRSGFLKRTTPKRPFVNAENGAMTIFIGEQPENVEYEIIDD